MGAYNWQDFEEAYRHAPDARTFYRRVGPEIIEKATEGIAEGKTLREKLGLLSPEAVKAAAPFSWRYGVDGEKITIAFADFAAENDSGHPEFDAILLVRRLYELDPAFDAAEKEGFSFVIRNGKITTMRHGIVLLYQAALLPEEEAAERRRAHKAEARGRAAEARRTVMPPSDAMSHTESEPEAMAGSEAETPTESDESIPEQLEWNREIIPTFDDSLHGAFEVIEQLESRNVRNYRFYAETGTMIRDDVLLDMGVASRRGKPDLAQTRGEITPGMWLRDYVDRKRGELPRKEFIRRRMMKESYLREGRAVRDWYERNYPQSWREKIAEHFHYHAGVLHARSNDRRNHIQWWSEGQIRGDIEFFEEMMNAWLDIDDFRVARLRPPSGGGFGFDTAFGINTGSANAEQLIRAARSRNPEARWDVWRIDSEDAMTRGGAGKLKQAATDAARYRNTKKTRNNYEPDEALVLLHTKYYIGGGRTRLNDFIDNVTAAYSVLRVMRLPENEQFSARINRSISVKVWSENGRVVGTLSRDDRLRVVGVRGGSYLIRTADGAEGFVAKHLVERHESVAEHFHLPETIQGKEVVYEFGRWTPDRINAMTARLQRLPTTEERMMALYEAWKDMPYSKRLQAGLREGYQNYTAREAYSNKLVVRLDAMDCTEFPIYALAILNARNYNDFVERLIKIKYRDGMIADENKLHYTSMRMENWRDQGLIEEVNLSDAVLRTDERSLTTIANRQYAAKRRYRYIPTEKISAAAPHLKTGDVFGMVISDNKNAGFGRDRATGRKREQIVGHMGFILVENGEAYFIHANASRYSSGEQAGISIAEYWDGGAHRLRKGTKRPLVTYLRQNARDFKGITVMRPTET